MGIFNFRKNKSISPEKLVAMAEKGYNIADLSKNEKEYLIKRGLEEINEIKSFEHKSSSKESSDKIEQLLDIFFPKSLYVEKTQEKTAFLNEIHLKFHKTKIELISLSTKWSAQSLAFEHKGQQSDSILFSKNILHHVVHVEIISKGEQTADINVCLTDISGKNVSRFEVELLKSEICVLSASTENSDKICLYSVEFGKYILRLSDSKKHLTSIPIHLEC
jgi:hypothetical protein